MFTAINLFIREGTIHMNQLEVLRESLGQCDEIVLDALLMRNRIVEDIMAYKEANERMAEPQNGRQTP